MMDVKVLTTIGDFEAGEGFSIVVGQEFSIIHNGATQFDWFSNNDSVLAFEVLPDSVKVKATSVGDCEFRAYEGDALFQKLAVKVISPKSEATNVKVKSKVEPLGT